MNLRTSRITRFAAASATTALLASALLATPALAALSEGVTLSVDFDDAEGLVAEPQSDAPAEVFAEDANVLIAEVTESTTTTMRLTLSVDTSVGNETADMRAEIPWVVTVEEEDDAVTPPDDGDDETPAPQPPTDDDQTTPPTDTQKPAGEKPAGDGQKPSGGPVPETGDVLPTVAPLLATAGATLAGAGALVLGRRKK